MPAKGLCDMNALVQFRNNAIGSLTPTPAERQKAAEDIWSNTTAKLNAAASTKTAVSGTAAASSAKSTAKSSDSGDSTSGTELDRDAFLLLLVTQMQNQDPLDPMDNEDMIAQLAQFSSLEQMEELNESFQDLASVSGQQSFVSASALLGYTVSGTSIAGDSVEGTVSRVYMEDGSVYLEVDDQIVALEDISQVEGTSESDSS